MRSAVLSACKLFCTLRSTAVGRQALPGQRKLQQSERPLHEAAVQLRVFPERKGDLNCDRPVRSSIYREDVSGQICGFSRRRQ